jgi:hypothetical protein
MEYDRLLPPKALMEFWKGVIESEEAIERETWLKPRGTDGKVAAERHVIGITDRRNGSEPIQCTAQNHDNQPRIPLRCMCEARHARPGRKRTGGCKKGAPIQSNVTADERVVSR